MVVHKRTDVLAPSSLAQWAIQLLLTSSVQLQPHVENGVALPAPWHCEVMAKKVKKKKK